MVDLPIELLVAVVGAVGAVIGAGLTALTGVIVSRNRMKEFLLKEKSKRYDQYLGNARLVLKEVYIPLSTLLYELSEQYDSHVLQVRHRMNASDPPLPHNFDRAVDEFLEAWSDLCRRGAVAYLITEIYEDVQELKRFIKNSQQCQSVKYERALIMRNDLFGIKMGSKGREVSINKTPDISLSGLLNIDYEYQRTLVAAPYHKEEFEEKFKGLVVSAQNWIRFAALGTRDLVDD